MTIPTTPCPFCHPDPDSLTLWQSYAREQIPKLFGARTSPQWQQSGFIFDEKAKTMVLLVTLEKSVHPEEHHYEYRFSQRRHVPVAEPEWNATER
jgi:hypothetical protein